MKRLAVWAIVFFAFCGLANSAYLTQSEQNGTPLLCNIEHLNGCNIVAASPYSHLFGISLAEYGLFFYAIVFFIAAMELVLVDQLLRRTLQALALAGFIASLYFTFLQVFIIKALCVYCMGSAALALFIFVAASYIEPVRTVLRKKSGDQEPPHEKVFSMPPTA